MLPPKYRKDRLAALALLGLVALNFPILSLFSRAERLFGIPILFLYLFLFWVSFVVLIALVVRLAKEEQL
ncbi:MAG: hypothetical protein HQM04_18265 [Magnetococcales bacterium]|nr:hypothetical protein [Magnetococcales bacterium]MBF0116973.1 hypothetical protein [Magnetococcales bacterium]